MNRGESRRVPTAALAAAMAALGLLGACVGPPHLDAGNDPLVVTEGDASSARSPERLAAVADMRRQGAAAETAAYPDVFQSAQTQRLAAREEPRSVRDADSIQAELAAIANRRQSTTGPAEIAALEARRTELLRLAARAGEGALRP